MNAYSRKGRVRKKLYTNACDKKRKNRPQMPVANKRKSKPQKLVSNEKGLPNQASKQLTPNERKQLKPLKNANGGLPAYKRWKKHHQITTV